MLRGSAHLCARCWNAALVNATGDRHAGGCGKCRQCGSDYALMPATTRREDAHVFCVEALPANSRVLANASRSDPWRHAVTMVAAAATLDIPPSGSLPFPIASADRFGFEGRGIF